MNEKLIRRAAGRFRNWMVKEFCNTSDIAKERNVLNTLNIIKNKTQDMEKWSNRFFEGTSPRFQTSKWEPTVRHRGIVSLNVYGSIAKTMIPDLGGDVISNIQYVISLFRIMTKKSEVTPLSPREAIAEIGIINKAWPDVRFRNGTLSLLVKNVTLADNDEEVYLGDFRVFLNLNYPLDKCGLSIEPVGDGVESANGFYHPHIKTGKLCKGQGFEAMYEALCQGRLEDYFRLVEAVLRTYNDSSLYEELKEWYEPSHEDQSLCETCEEWRDNDVISYCTSCRYQYCDSCSSSSCCFECNEDICSECNVGCHNCEESMCHSCSESCNECNNHFCSSCLVMCTICRNKYCESCVKTCAYCGDTVCENCMATCNCCNDYCCVDCVVDNCNECEVDICKECQVTCYVCKNTICNSCNDNSCEHCGVSMCLSCEKEHNCLLEKVS